MTACRPITDLRTWLFQNSDPSITNGYSVHLMTANSCRGALWMKMAIWQMPERYWLMNHLYGSPVFSAHVGTAWIWPAAWEKRLMMLNWRAVWLASCRMPCLLWEITLIRNGGRRTTIVRNFQIIQNVRWRKRLRMPSSIVITCRWEVRFILTCTMTGWKYTLQEEWWTAGLFSSWILLLCHPREGIRYWLISSADWDWWNGVVAEWRR